MNRKNPYDSDRNDFQDPNYGSDPYAQDPYQPYPNTQGSYQQNPYGQDPYSPFDAYHDPYAQVNDNEMNPNNGQQGNSYANREDPYDGYDSYHEEVSQTAQRSAGRGDPRYQGAYMNAQKEEKEEKKKHRFLLWIIFLLALIMFLYSAWNLFKIFKANWDERRETEQMIEIGNIPEDPETPFTVNWEGLREVNDQVKAWIIVPDTNISYPIVQGSDNAYYLDHTFAKEVNYAGAVFIDYHNQPDFSDNNTFVYGHNVRHETMFSQLEKFMDKDFFDDHKYVYIFTPQQNYKCEVISFHSTYDRSPYYHFGIIDIDEWKEYIKLIMDPNINGHVRSDVTMGESDRIVTLSTCSFEIDDEPSERRYLMHLKLVPWIGQYKEDNTQGPTGK